MPGVPSRAPDTVSRGSGVPDQRNPATVSGAPHRDHGRAAGPDQWPGDEAVWSLLREGLLRPLCAL